MENSESNNIIAKGSLLKGNLNVPGNIRLEGKVVGNVKSKSKIVCGETSVIEGNVNAVNAEIAGKVTGKVNVEELLILKLGFSLLSSTNCKPLPCNSWTAAPVSK